MDSHSLLMTWRRSFRPEPTGPQAEQAGFVPAMIVAETEPMVPAALASGRMVIIVGKDRRVIVEATFARSAAGQGRDGG